MQSWTDFVDSKSFAAVFVGGATLGTSYQMGANEWGLMVVPLLVMAAYWLAMAWCEPVLGSPPGSPGVGMPRPELTAPDRRTRTPVLPLHRLRKLAVPASGSPRVRTPGAGGWHADSRSRSRQSTGNAPC
jgi:hypothetical protein